jgi:exodeoxyribonuclease-1
MVHLKGYMKQTLYFYDLETTGISAKNGRIMQFAGQRTDLSLKPIGEPDNILIKLTDDILPEPDAVLITGITPQSTFADGLTEAEFLRIFAATIAVPGTIFTGFNSVRFDDEFMRYTQYRNFYDPYEWVWKDDRSRWDLLDVVRMTRALRPEGINWPFAPDGKPANRLELLTKLNKLDHENAHDALSDVYATIAVARLIYNKQQKLFEYLLGMRDKKKIQELVCAEQPFVYSSGKYPSAYEKTTVAVSLGNHPDKQGVLVFDLRHDPAELAGKTPAELVAWWTDYKIADETKRFPVKTLQFNRCPAVAPLGVLDESSQERLKIDLKKIEEHFKALKKYPDLRKNLLAAVDLMNKKRQATFLADPQDVDGQLYDGFIEGGDKTAMSVVRAASKDEIASLDIGFKDPRLTGLLPLYKARNFRGQLSTDELEQWETFRRHRLLNGGGNSKAARYFARLAELAERPNLSPQDQFLLEELQLYGQSVLPNPDEDSEE